MTRFKTDILWLLVGSWIGASGIDMCWDYAVSLVCSRVLRASNNPFVLWLHVAARLNLRQILSRLQTLPPSADFPRRTKDCLAEGRKTYREN